MKWFARTVVAAVMVGLIAVPAPAQQRPSTGSRDAVRPPEGRDTRMLITVIDQTNAVIPGATVTVLGAEPATQKAEYPAVQTTQNGLATIAGLTPGRYSARAEFQEIGRAHV